VIAAIVCAVILGRLHEMHPALQRLPVGKVLLPLGILLLVRRKDLSARLAVFRTPPGTAFIVFVAMMALSVPTSMVQTQSLNAFLAFLYGPIPFVVILACAPDTVQDLATLMKAVVIALLVVGVGMLTGLGASYGDRLAGSSTYDPNDLALVAASSFPFAVHLFRDRRRVWRVVGLGAALMLLTMVVLGASRGGVIALATVLVATLLMRSHLKLRWKVAIVPLISIALASAPSVFWERIATLGDVQSDYNVNSQSGRIEIWKRGVQVLIENPLTGVGYDQFATADGTFRTREASGDKSWHTAHNAPLQVGVEIGVIGLVAFFALYVPTIRAARRARRLVKARRIDPAFRRVGDTLTISLLGFGVGALFLSAGFSIIAMTLAAMGMAYTHLLRRAVRAAAAASAPGRPRGSRTFAPRAGPNDFLSPRSHAGPNG
jgi:O-antigen ligase